MIVKVDDRIERKLSDPETLRKFLKENTSGGRVSPFVEVFRGTSFSDEKESGNDSWFWTMSTGNLDRDFERIDTKGWMLDSYLENPVVLWSHDWSIPAIGHAENLSAEGKLTGWIRFNSRETDCFGWSIGQRVREGSIRSGSVGFRVEEVEFTEGMEDGTRMIYRKQELLEFSICNIPANPFALRDGGNEKDYGLWNALTGGRK